MRMSIRMKNFVATESRFVVALQLRTGRAVVIYPQTQRRVSIGASKDPR